MERIICAPLAFVIVLAMLAGACAADSPNADIKPTEKAKIFIKSFMQQKNLGSEESDTFWGVEDCEIFGGQSTDLVNSESKLGVDPPSLTMTSGTADSPPAYTLRYPVWLRGKVEGEVIQAKRTAVVEFFPAVGSRWEIENVHIEDDGALGLWEQISACAKGLLVGVCCGTFLGVIFTGWLFRAAVVPITCILSLLFGGLTGWICFATWLGVVVAVLGGWLLWSISLLITAKLTGRQELLDAIKGEG